MLLCATVCYRPRARQCIVWAPGTSLGNSRFLVHSSHSQIARAAHARALMHSGPSVAHVWGILFLLVGKSVEARREATECLTPTGTSSRRTRISAPERCAPPTARVRLHARSRPNHRTDALPTRALSEHVAQTRAIELYIEEFSCPILPGVSDFRFVHHPIVPPGGCTTRAQYPRTRETPAFRGVGLHDIRHVGSV